jgi:nucleoside phosphorylase
MRPESELPASWLWVALPQEYRSLRGLLAEPRRYGERGVVGRLAGRPVGMWLGGVGPRRTLQQLALWQRRCCEGGLAGGRLISVGWAGGLRGDLKAAQSLWVEQLVRQPQVGDDPARAEPARQERHGPRAGGEPLGAAVVCRRTRWPDDVPAARLLSLSRPALTPQHKRWLRETTAADICDMESHTAASWAARCGWSWSGWRVVSDTVAERLPGCGLVVQAMIERGEAGRAVGVLATQPHDWGPVLRLALRLPRLRRSLTRDGRRLLPELLGAAPAGG